MVGWLSGWQYRKKHDINGSSAGAVSNYQMRVKVHYGEGADSGEDVYLGSGIYNVESGSWNIGGNTYNYRLKITIAEKAGQNLTDYQVKVVINTKQLVDKGYATSSGNEVRFADDQDNLLNFWRENAFDQEETVYWVKVPSIPASSEVVIYMYFDPDLTDVPDASDGDATFILFDDFSTKDTSKWNWPSDWTVESGYAKQTYSGGWPPSGGMWSLGDLNVSISDSVGVIIETYAKNLGTASAYDMVIGWDNDTDRPPASNVSVALGSYDHWHEWGTSTANTDFGEPDERSWHKYQVILFDGDWRLIIDGTQYSAHAGSITKLAAVSFNSKGQSYWDWIRVRKYVDPEPEAKPETAEKCKSDFADIRFTAGDGVTLLDYWMEEKVDGDYAIFWVKVPSIPADPDKATIYIYYGNPDAVYDGDGEQVFELFDDFEGAELDTTKWNTHLGTGGSVSVSSGQLVMQEGSGGADASTWTTVYSKQSFDDVAVRARIKFTAMENILLRMGAADEQFYVFRLDGRSGYYDLIGKYPAGATITTELVTGSASPTNTWYKHEARAYGSQLRLYKDDAEELSTADSDFTSGWIGVTTDGTSGTVYVDWILVRKYVEPEPSHGAWYAEEGLVAIIELSDVVVSCDAIGRGVGVSRLDGVKGVDVLVRGVSLVEVELVKVAEVVEVSSMLVFSGIVQTPLGDPYPNAKVLAIDEETWEIVGETTSGVDGSWSMVLPGGRRYTFVAVGAELSVGADAKAHVKY